MHANRGHRISRRPFFRAAGASLRELVVLALLFLASLAYAAMGGTFALEASPVAEWAPARTEAAVMTADAGGALGKGNASVRAVQPADYFPAGYANRGRDGDGNVATYEHD